MKFWPNLIYNLLIQLLGPALLVFTVRQSLARKGGWQFVRQRMGWYGHAVAETGARTTKPSPQDRSIWIHAASVGEVRTALPLLKYIISTHPTTPVTCSCNTPEGHQTLINSHLNVSVVYCAIDFSRATHRMFKRINPAILILVETELWPAMLHRAGVDKLPVVIVNGRLSNKTRNAPSMIKSLYRSVSTNISAVLARSTEDAANFVDLGVDRSRIVVAGNLKSAYQKNVNVSPIKELRPYRYIVAASTHAPEERILVEMSRQLPEGILLVLVPRHPQRSAELQKLLRDMQVSFAVRSQGQIPTDSTSVYLADRTGELDMLFSNADAVFVGGTLAPIGGHNLFEPAAWGKAIVCGPGLSNFKAEADLLTKHDALWIVADKTALLDAFTTLLTSPTRSTQMGTNAENAMDMVQGIFENYQQGVSKHISDALGQ